MVRPEVVEERQKVKEKEHLIESKDEVHWRRNLKSRTQKLNNHCTGQHLEQLGVGRLEGSMLP